MIGLSIRRKEIHVGLSNVVLLRETDVRKEIDVGLSNVVLLRETDVNLLRRYRLFLFLRIFFNLLFLFFSYFPSTLTNWP